MSKPARADAEASAADLRAAQVAVAGDVAGAYVELRGLQERLRVARANRENQQRTLDLVEARLDAGSASDFDGARARAQLEATSSRIPALEAAEAVAMHRIAVLTGRPPEALIAALIEARAVARVAREASIPARRPTCCGSVRTSPRPRHACMPPRRASASPPPTCSRASPWAVLLGSQAGAASALFERDSETRLVALGIDWSFLDVGRVRARIAASDADADAALARYQQTVIRALQDTEDALVRLDRSRQEDTHLQRAALDSAQAAKLARIRFDAGATGLFEMLDVERAQLQAEDAFAEVACTQRDRRRRTLQGAGRRLAAITADAGIDRGSALIERRSMHERAAAISRFIST